jgi:uncharacterized protein (DUF305 family)
MSRLFPYLVVSVLLVGPSAAQTEHELIDCSARETMAGGNPDPSFRRVMAEAMDRMTRDMAVPHTGDPDRDFAAMMIPHHQGAIDMALLQLKYGHDEKLKRLAQSIIVEQGQEIAYMRVLLDPPSGAATAANSSADR